MRFRGSGDFQPVMFDAASFLAAVAAPAVSAAPAPPPQGAIVITASRTEAAPAGGLSVVESEEIERRQPGSLLEVLDDVAGVRAFSTGGAGGRSFLSIRGGEPNFTLVLLDGHQAQRPDQQPRRRVRLLRPRSGPGRADRGGPGRRLRGPRIRRAGGGGQHPAPGAEAGGQRATARAQVGSEGDAGFGAGLEAGWSDGGALAAASWYDSGGLTAGSSLKRRQGLAQLRHRLGGFEARLLGLYGHSDRSAFPEDSGGPRLAVNREREQGEAGLAAAGLSLRRAPSAEIRPNLSLSWSRQRDRSDTPAIAPGLLDGTPALTADSLFTRFEAVGDVGLGSGPVVATVGAAWLRESGRSDGTIDFGFPLPVTFDFVRTTRSAFAEASRGLAKASASTSPPATTTSPAAAGAGPGERRRRGSRFAAGRRSSPGSGEGYKLPSFYALAHPLIGNPALRPERSRNFEAGAELASEAGNSIRLALFSNRFRDLIDFDPATFTTVNRDRVRARGAELEGRWRPLSSLIVAGALSLLDLDSPTPLRGRPRRQGSLRAAWQASAALEIDGALRFNSDYLDSSIPTGPVRAEGHFEADLGLRYRLSSRFTLAAALRNLTGERFEDSVGFPAPRRSARASLAAEF